MFWNFILYHLCVELIIFSQSLMSSPAQFEPICCLRNPKFLKNWNFCAYFEKQFGKSVNMIYNNNGTECM